MLQRKYKRDENIASQQTINTYLRRYIRKCKTTIPGNEQNYRVPIIKFEQGASLSKQQTVKLNLRQLPLYQIYPFISRP